TPSLTGAKADHRLGLPARAIAAFARTLAARLGVQGVGAAAPLSDQATAWLDPLVRDLQAQRGASVIIPGSTQPPAVHALAHAMNHLLGNAGQTVVYTAPLEAEPVDPIASLRQLVEDMDRGQGDPQRVE